jgi:hypothetical protein
MSEPLHCRNCAGGEWATHDDFVPCPGLVCPTCASDFSSDPNRARVPMTEYLRLQNATRKVVEAAARWKSAKDSAVRGFSEREPGVMTDFMGASKALLEQSIAMDDLQAALSDPILVALRRE